MQMEHQRQSVDYAHAAAALVANLPPERAAQVYDFVRFLQQQSTDPSPLPSEDDWLNDSEEQLQAEDELWNVAQARHQETFASLVAAARAEIEAGATEPLFTEDGELNLP